MEKIDIKGIMKVLPHRPPFLLLDQIIDVVPGVSCKAKKNVTFNEEFFRGHYSDLPVMLGMLIIEALAPTGGYGILTLEANKNKTPFFAGINKAKFRKQVVPGDTLILEVTIDRLKSSAGKGTGKAYVDGILVCEVELTFMLG
ncbi:MAG: 3-hydroxyacyl-ACP dehydratase FabZ [Clostridium sp.]|nr:3-hydroxyacyl-ACP dehydratase FabZ [Clostridium sp.]